MTKASESQVISLAYGEYALDVLPQLGGALAGMRFRDVEILRRVSPTIDEPLQSAGFALLPFANRIAYGQFRYGTRQVQLARNAPGQSHPLHGQAWRAPWTIDSCDAREVALSFEYSPGEWPWGYRAREVLSLDEGGLTVQLTLENRSSEPMPAGIGWHPYLRRTAQTRLRAEVRGVWLTDERALPTDLASAGRVVDWSQSQPLPDTLIDHCYAGWNGRVEVDCPEDKLRVCMSAGEPLRWLHVYVPPRESFLCIEPVSHMPNALNRPESPQVSGLRELAPGGVLTSTITLTVTTE